MNSVCGTRIQNRSECAPVLHLRTPATGGNLETSPALWPRDRPSVAPGAPLILAAAIKRVADACLGSGLFPLFIAKHLTGSYWISGKPELIYLIHPACERFPESVHRVGGGDGEGIGPLLYLLLVSVWNVNGGFCDGFSSPVRLTG